MPKNKYPQPKYPLEKDFLVVLLLNALGFVYAWLTRGQYHGTIIYSMIAVGIPAIIYMAMRRKKSWLKVLLFALTAGALYGFLLEFVAEYNHIWDVPNPSFPIKFFGFLPAFDVLIGHMLMTGYTAVFYEHFVDEKYLNRKISWPHLLYGVVPIVLAIAAVLIAFSIDPNLVKSSRHLYLYIGIAAIIPTIIYALRKPIVIKNMALTGAYFFFFYMALEIIGVNLSFWTFEKGTYVGYVNVLGAGFPFEEVFFWMGFYSSFLVFFYEKFIDNE